MKLYPYKRWVWVALLWVALPVHAAITVTPGGGGAGDVTAAGLAAGDFIASEIYNTNTPTRGLNDAAAMTPDLTINWFYVWSGALPPPDNGISYYTNLTYYSSNMFREFRTNGYYAAGWNTIDLDGGWAQTTRTGGGDLTWSTAYFENGQLPMSLPDYITFAHSNGWKVMLYSSLSDTPCNPPSSPITYAYRDIQKMMSWGADGVKLDNCVIGSTGETNTYYSAYYRTVNQAINDYYAATQATNGECRPFKILATGSTAEGWPNSITTDTLFGVNQISFQPTIIALDISDTAPWNHPGLTNHTSMIREVVKFKPFFRPGSVVYTGIGVYGNNPGSWTNMIGMAVLGCQPIEAGLGSVLGMFNSGLPPTGDQWADTFYPSFSQYLTNSEVFAMLRDNLVIPATITSSNIFLETWNRPLENGDTCLGISNFGPTNRVVTLNYYDLGISPGVGYAVRNVWNKTNLLSFTNTLSWTQEKESVSLLRLIPKRTINANTISADSLTVGGASVGGRFTETTYPMKSLTIFGTGLSATSVGSQGAFNNNEGLVQTAANQAGGFNIPVPDWASTVSIVGRYYSAFAGTVAWTNAPFISYYHPGGRVQKTENDDPVNIPNIAVICPSGNYVTVTNTIVFASTNAPKEIYLQMNASSNASARHVIGPLSIKYQ